MHGLAHSESAAGSCKYGNSCVDCIQLCPRSEAKSSAIIMSMRIADQSYLPDHDLLSLAIMELGVFLRARLSPCPSAFCTPCC